MKQNFWIKWIAVLLLVLTFAGVAAAEETYFEEEFVEDSVELYAAGGMAESLRTSYTLSSFESYIVRQLLASTDSIDLRAFDLLYEDFKPLYQDVINKHPELFNVKAGYSYGRPTNDPTRITSLKPQYKYAGDELTSMMALYNSGVNAVLEYANKADTTVGKLLRASDYLCANFSYDVRVYSTSATTKAQTVYSPELFFKEGTGVCQAYMLVYRAVLNELGIPNTTASSDEMNHIWNMVYVDDFWYHVDVTWNDAMTNKKDMPLRALHTYFMLSDTGIGNANHYGWEATEKALDTTYDDYFWASIKYPAAMLGDVVYYADSTNAKREDNSYWPTLCTFDLATGESKKLFSYQVTRYVPGLHPVWVSDSLVYFTSSNHLYAAKHNGSNVTRVYSTSNYKELLLQFYQDGSTLKIHVTTDPNAPGSVRSYKLTEVSFGQKFLETNVGKQTDLQELLVMSKVFDGTTTWTSTSDNIAAVDQNGLLTAAGIGTATITATIDGLASDSVTLLVHSANPMVLPSKTQTIAPSAFAGIPADEIVLPEGITSIGAQAFVGCTALKMVNLPASLTAENIAEDAFADLSVMLLCSSEDGVSYAQAQNLPYVIMPDE